MTRKNYGYILMGVVMLLVFSTCAIPHYQHTYESTKGLDLRSGKWLINTIDSDLPLKSQDALAMRLMKKLNKIGGISVVYIDSVSLHYLVPSQLEFDLAPETLAVLSGTTDFDYIVNVKATQLSDEMGSVVVPPNFSHDKNEAEVYIDVYDLASGERIYSQRIIATVSTSENDDQVRLAKSASGLIFGALNKGIKEIRKYSIRN